MRFRYIRELNMNFNLNNTEISVSSKRSFFGKDIDLAIGILC